MKRCVVLLAVLAGGCGKREQVQSGVGSGSGAGSGSTTCEQMTYPPTVEVAEASGAAWLEVGGKQALIVVADSGHTGDYVIIDAVSGTELERGKLPLAGGEKTDDIEGLASRSGLLYGLTSSGWMRVWKRVGSGFELVDGPYPIAAAGTGDFGCPIDDSNCGKNYEGLALAPSPKSGCSGFACSKQDGHLYCLTEQNGKLAVDQGRSIAVERKNVLADCAFSPQGALYTGNNMFGMSVVYEVHNWADPPKARVEQIGELGVGFPEVIAVAGNIFYRISDTGGSPSMMAKFRCLAPGR